MKCSLDPLLKKILNVREISSPEELMLFQKTQKYVRLVAWIPGLRMIAICNSLSMYASDSDSDIDLFVVSDPERMWLVRGLLTLAFQVLGVRRQGDLVKGRFCLSFFATTESLDMGKIALDQDPYLEAWTHHLMPILDRGDTHGKFRGINSSWRKIVPGYAPDALKYCQSLPYTKEYFSPLWKWLDRLFRSLFIRRTLTVYERLGKPWGIIISDDMLKFHKDDRRKEVLEEWKSKK